MAVDKGCWFENQEEVSTKIDGISDDGSTWVGDVTGDVTGDINAAAYTTTESGAGTVATVYGKPRTTRREENGTIITEIKVDITGWSVKGTQAKDCIGLTGGATKIANIGRHVVATDGIVYKVEMVCLELPGEGTATITADIDLGATDNAAHYQADAGAVDDIVINTNSLVKGETAQNLVPALTANDYLYLIEGDTAASTGIYNAGMYIVRLYGHPALA